MAVFIDSSFLIALSDPRDPWHKHTETLRLSVDAARPFHIHDLAVAETIASVGSRRGGTTARVVYESIRDDMVIHFPTLDDLDASMEIVVRFDGGVSLSDAYAIVLIERHRLDGVVSFDEDFDKAGIQRLGAR